ncbi:hypothetical protein EV646_114197 [Kribbella antiqua]|uniref:Uncharacterized protein n=1 Tax=Kribbella antiqua TaxID=2512217 RepID=A0A4R2ICR9_9ACTN|nr:hypothetical protein EV646_114197 [Kribbella antiqua]
MQGDERQLHLGLDTGCSRDPARGRVCLDVVQQGGLPDAGFTTQHQRGALSGSQIGYDPIESLALASPAFQLKAPVSAP